MSWGEIKKALNSTLGTPQFKPLDVIIREAIAEGARFQELEVVSNGEYTPDAEHDGFSRVIVNVPIPSYETYDGVVIVSGDWITFTIDGETYEARAGWTWEQWVDTEYNTNNYAMYDYNGAVLVDESYALYLNGEQVNSVSETIVADGAYTLEV